MNLQAFTGFFIALISLAFTVVFSRIGASNIDRGRRVIGVTFIALGCLIGFWGLARLW